MIENNPFEIEPPDMQDGNLFENLKRLETGPDLQSDGNLDDDELNRKDELFADLGTPCLHERVESQSSNNKQRSVMNLYAV